MIIMWKCPICKKWDEAENMVSGSYHGWLGKAHLNCIKTYNETHKKKYSVRVYDENSKFFGTYEPQ